MLFPPRPLLLIALAVPLGAPAVAAPQITAGDVTAHVRYLASPELQGRGSGTPGGEKAAEYLAGQFRKIGLKPAGERGTFFQGFPVIAGIRVGEGNALAVRGEGTVAAPKVREDFMPVAFSANARAAGPLVFAGYGISRPELKHDDYEGLDVRGKIVVVLRRTPDNEEHGKFAAYAPLRDKATVAREKGAAGILFLTGPLTSDREDLGNLEPDGSFADSGIPAAIVRRRVVEPLFKASNRDLRDLQTSLAHGQNRSFALPGATAELKTDVVRERRETRNVLGRLEGSDPQLRNEVVVIGAHYDHLGLGGSGSRHEGTEAAIHHGADDNASGTAGIIELAEYFASQKEAPRRSLVFIGFSGEEMGLLGSAYYVRQPTTPLDRTVAMINLDMIGRSKNDAVQVLGTQTSPQWESLLKAVNREVPLNLRTAGGGSGFGASDQASFYARDIPVLFFFTGVHEDYHRPTDTWDKVNAAGEAKILRFVAATVGRVADAKQRPQFARAADPAPATASNFAVYVGTVPDYSEEGMGVTLTGVREGSPAERAGIKAGDVIVEFGGKKVANVYDYTYALRDAKPDVPVKIVVLRSGKRVEASVTPAARR